MANHQSNHLYLHPLLHSALPSILKTVTAALPDKWKAGTSSQGIHRTPNEQFEIFKKGRVFKNGRWVKVGTTFTGKDGFKKKSRHNFLPATAVDIILIQPNGKELEAGPQELEIGKGAAAFDFEWGGDWPPDQQDLPHIQLPSKRLFKSSLVMDEALQWQKYLLHGNFLTSEVELDGLWGDISKAALQKAVGTSERTPNAWEALFNKFGALEDLPTFDHLPWVPSVRV